MENTRIVIDWYIPTDKVKMGLKTKKSSPNMIYAQKEFTVTWSYEEGFTIDTTSDDFAVTLKWIEEFNKKQKVKKLFTRESETFSIIHVEGFGEDITQQEWTKFFEPFGLELDGLLYGYPTPKKKPNHGIGKRGDKSISDVSGSTERTLDITYCTTAMAYLGEFKKIVAGVLKVHAQIKVQRIGAGELVLLTASDKLRGDINFPKDTFASIDKQCNALYTKK